MGVLAGGTDLFRKANSYTAIGGSSSANAHFSKLNNYSTSVFHSHIFPRHKEDKMAENS